MDLKCSLDNKEKISAYLDGLLEDDKKASLLSHLETCPACSDYYLDLKKIIDYFKEEPPDLPGHLYEEIKSALDAEMKAPQKSKITLFKGKFTLIAACLCLVVWLAGGQGVKNLSAPQTGGSMVQGAAPAAPAAPRALMLAPEAPESAPAEAGGGAMSYSAASDADGTAALRNSGVLDIEKQKILTGQKASDYVRTHEVSLPKTEFGGTLTSNAQNPADKASESGVTVTSGDLVKAYEVEIKIKSEHIKSVFFLFPYEVFVKDTGETAYLISNADYHEFLRALETGGISLEQSGYANLTPEMTPVAVIFKTVSG